MPIKEEGETLKLIKKEENRLKRIFKKEADSKMDIAISLIERAAFMRVQLDILEADILENGFIEWFSQSPDVPAYERERIVTKQFNSMVKMYGTLMKQLNDLLPNNVNLKTDTGSQLMEFIQRK